LFLGGKQGVKSLLALIDKRLSLIAFVLLPLSLAMAINPSAGWQWLSALLTTGATMYFVCWSGAKKALAAILGTIGGVIVAGHCRSDGDCGYAPLDWTIFRRSTDSAGLGAGAVSPRIL
jgi:uncharacterized membrane protein